MKQYKCKSCGAPLSPDPERGESYLVCPYCGSVYRVKPRKRGGIYARDHSVAIGGNVSGGIIVTGNNNAVSANPDDDLVLVVTGSSNIVGDGNVIAISHGKKYNISFGHAEGLAIGDNAVVINTSGKPSEVLIERWRGDNGKPLTDAQKQHILEFLRLHFKSMDSSLGRRVRTYDRSGRVGYVHIVKCRGGYSLEARLTPNEDEDNYGTRRSLDRVMKIIKLLLFDSDSINRVKLFADAGTYRCG